MGLDISIQVDNTEDIFTPEYYSDEKFDSFHQHNLSRTFCNFMCRQNVVTSIDPELDQIGQITKVDITPLYDMEKYWDEESADFEINFAETDEEKEGWRNRIKSDRSSITGNIDIVGETINNLITKLSKIDNLPQLLKRDDFDSLDVDVYFSDFNKDKGQGYIGNNFGQDLRNFKRFLDYAKEHGSTTVYFRYG